MFKNSNNTAPQKNGPITFIKTAASPRHVNSAKSIPLNHHQFSIDQYSKQSGASLLSLQISYDKFSQPHRCVFTYNSETCIKQLLIFVKKEIQEEYVQLKYHNVNLEYLLTLGERKVKELGVKKIELTANKIKIFDQGTLLNNFQFVKCIGTGGFSRVYLCRGYGKLMALKAIGKHFIVENEKQNIVESQRNILEKCSGHPFITKLYMSFETQNYLIFCMEYCNGGELFNLLRKVRRMKEPEAKFYFLETLAALTLLHSQKILYRDLKPENIIIDSEGHIRLADYGLSKIMKDDMTHSFCGSAEYMAPEMLLKKGHSFEIDYYCLGALLYELLFGLPPYYSRNQNQLFSNILTKELQFPQNIEISKDLKKFLHRMLEKDTDMRFKTIAEIMKHPWMKDVNMSDVLAKRLDPPFKTDMFENNFDNSDFERDEEKEMLKLQKEKDLGKLQQHEIVFPDFTYICDELGRMEKDIAKEREKKLDFSKKPSQVVNFHQGEKTLLRSNTMKSIDTSKFYMENQYQQLGSPRSSQTQNAQQSRSGEKLKMFIAQATKLPSSGYGSHITTPQLSHFGPSKASQILNASRQSSGLFNTSGSKIVEVRNTPYVSKIYNQSPSQERMGSPININNYISIYTNKSPSKGPQLSFTNPSLNASNALKKPQNHPANYSFQRSIINNSINSSFKNSYNSYGSSNCSLQRMKFNSLDKPLLQNSHSSNNFLRNSPYYHQQPQPAPTNGGYLSNFKQRLNPSHKVKKSYKTNQKMNFNFFSPSTPFSRS